MVRLNHVKQEQDDEQKKVSFKNTQQQNNEGDDASTCQLSVQGPKLVKIEEEEDGIVKQVQPCTKVKKEEECGECKLEWDGDECDCLECKVDRTIKVEFNQSNATNNQQKDNNCLGISDAKKDVPSQSSVCKRVKKEEDEDDDEQWDEDCDCDDCRRMRQKAIRLKQTNLMENQGTGGDDDEETEIDEGEFEMEVDGEESSDDEETEQFGNKTIHNDQQPNGQIVQIEEDDEETEIEDNQGGDEEESRTLEGSRIETILPHHSGQTSKIVRQSVRHLKRKQTYQDQEIATECTINLTQPNLAQSNRHLKCQHCHKSFDHKSKLHAHVRVHTGERPFQCGLCDKRFNDKSNLTKHQLIHQNIKRFRCHECDKQFTLKHILDSHLRIHSGGRPFECRHCEKSFTQLHNRNRHEQAIHLHVKPYRCKLCGHTATEQSAIITHIRLVHFGLPQTKKKNNLHATSSMIEIRESWLRKCDLFCDGQSVD